MWTSCSLVSIGIHDAKLYYQEYGINHVTTGNGWIASQVKQLLQASGKTVATSHARLENRDEVMRLVTHATMSSSAYVFD
jgi:hypothetical protein